MINRDDAFRASIAAAAASDDVRGEDEVLVEVMARAMTTDYWPYDRRPWSEQRALLENARRALDALRRYGEE